MKTLSFIILIFSFWSLNAQDTHKKVKIFYDCQAGYCETTFIKQNLEQVEFVRDRKFADVHIITLSERAGSGGQVFHLNFIGQNDYKDIQQKYDFSIDADSTRDNIRKKLLKYLQLGLLQFWYKNGLTDNVEIKLNLGEKEKIEAIDKWHHWVFKIGGNTWLNGDSNSSNRNISGYASATKVDKKNKFSFRLRYNNGHSKYTFNGNEIKSVKESFYASSYYIWGINEHWSYGVFTGFNRSMYSNYKRAFSTYGGLEYSFFPYKDAASKSLVLTTKLGNEYNRYFEKTVYNKIDEMLWSGKVSLSSNLVKKWGSIYAGINYSTYLHDIKLYAVGFSMGTDLRIAKGLNLNTNGHYSIQHDQINIAAGNLTLEETLLRQKQLQSGYNYFVSMGLSYSFGSIYNSIVNPRFNGGGSTRTYYFF